MMSTDTGRLYKIQMITNHSNKTVDLLKTLQHKRSIDIHNTNNVVKNHITTTIVVNGNNFDLDISTQSALNPNTT